MTDIVAPPLVVPPKKRRLDHVDAMRPVKQAGVVSTHTLLWFAPGTLSVGAALMLLHVTRESFLFVSSCMLCYSYPDLKKVGYKLFYKRRIISVVLPYVAWTVIYFFVTLHDQGPGAMHAFIHFWYLLGTGYYQLYYLIVIMEFYAVYPLLAWLVRVTRGHHIALMVASLLFQVAMTSLMHWRVLPEAFHGFWASREITSYLLYLIGGMVAATHLEEFHDFLIEHAWGVIAATVAFAALAEVWLVASVHHWFTWTGGGSDPLQPIVIPFNIAAILTLYLIGVWLVDHRRSGWLRAWVRSGSDNAYGVYLAQMVFILGLHGLSWRSLDHHIPWPIVSILTLVIVFSACVLLTALLARTPLSVALTGRTRQSWATFLPEGWRRGVPDPVHDRVESAIDLDPKAQGVDAANA